MTTQAEVTIGRPREEVFDAFICDAGLVAFCQKLGPFAAIAESKTHGELDVGARRSVRMSDGLELEETISEHARPRLHGYWWADPALPIGALIKRADGLWRFREVDGSAGAKATKVTWQYTFTLRSSLLWLPGQGLLVGFRRWMQAGLDRGKASLER